MMEYKHVNQVQGMNISEWREKTYHDRYIRVRIIMFITLRQNNRIGLKYHTAESKLLTGSPSPLLQPFYLHFDESCAIIERAI